jgi:hypothetical protein
VLPGQLVHGKPALGVTRSSESRRHPWSGIIDFETHCVAHDFPCFSRRSQGGGTLHFPARVFEDLTLVPLDEAPTDSVHGVQAEMGTIGIGNLS